MRMVDSSAFAKRLELVLDARDKGQTDLATAVGITPQSAHQWVKGKSVPKPIYWKAICDFLGTTERWLFWGEGSMNETESAQKGTLRIPHYENSVALIDRHLGKEVPLVALEGISVSNDSVQPVKLPTTNVTVQAKFPTGERSVAFIMRDRSMEPEIQQGDMVIIDQELDPEPEDYVVVHIKARNQNVFRKFTYGTNGEVLLTPANPSYERFRFSAEEWLGDVILIGVTTEYTRRCRY